MSREVKQHVYMVLMFLTLLVIVFGSVVARSETRDYSYRPLDRDKMLHTGVSAAITGFGYLFFDQISGGEYKRFSLLTASSMAFIVGYAAEMSDAINRNDSNIDTGDLVANGVGIGIAATAIYMIDIWGYDSKKKVSVIPTGNGLVVGWRF